MKQLFGSGSSLLVGACCLGLTPVLGALSAIGLGFVINDLILLPLLALTLGFTLWSLWQSGTRHGMRAPFYTGVVASITAFAGLWVFVPLSYAGFLLLLATTVWDYVHSKSDRDPVEQ
jgi:mercuric ion transport protein